jgi:hypothetical protein
MTDLMRAGTGFARANWGRWLIDCGRPGCLSALEVGHHLRDQNGAEVRHGVDWFEPSMRCWDCGWVTEHIVWPHDPDSIEIVLAMRPAEITRNWWPGETLESLMLENIAHGILPPDHLLEGGAGPLMVCVGDSIVGGRLAELLPQFQAARRLHEIEG